jgi:hypothetical protein
MAGRVGDDEGALVGREIAIGHVDGDALFTLGLKAVEQESEIRKAEIVLLAAGIALKACRLVFLDRLGVPKQPADQRRFAVVDAAAGDEAKGARVAHDPRSLLHRKGYDGLIQDCVRCCRCGHQKYPSRFFFSIEPA